MRYESKFRIVRAVLWVNLGISIFCLYMLYENGLVNLRAAVTWFWCLLVMALVTVCTAVQYNYYRSKRVEARTQAQIKVETLARLAVEHRPPVSKKDS